MNNWREQGKAPMLNSFSMIWVLTPLIIIVISSCAPYRYLSMETLNPASITLPVDMRRILIVNNALPQDEVPFESNYHQLSESVTLSVDSAAFEFCRTLGETLADFSGFDDVRLLEGCLRTDMLPLLAPTLQRDDVELLCDEHETDIVISLDRLLYRVSESDDYMFGIPLQNMFHVETMGVLRVYMPGRETPLANIMLGDTLIFDLWYEQNDEDVWNSLNSINPDNLFNISARYIANEARTHFIPYWSEDLRWYYTSFTADWKEATAYAGSEKWDKAVAIWKKLYGQTTSWKQRARLCSNLALGAEMTGDFEQALQYAKLSHQLMLDHLGADHLNTKKQELYVNVLTSRITEEQKLKLQM